MALLSNHNQAYSRLIVNGFEVNNRADGDPIRLNRINDSASGKDGLDGGSISFANAQVRELEVDVWANSNLREFAQQQMRLAEVGMNIPFSCMLITSFGEAVALIDCAIASDGGYTTGGGEKQAHTVKIIVSRAEEVL